MSLKCFILIGAGQIGIVSWRIKNYVVDRYLVTIKILVIHRLMKNEKCYKTMCNINLFLLKLNRYAYTSRRKN